MFTVTTEATKTALTTLAAVKTEFNITGSSEDEWLTSQIDVATGVICDFLNVATASDGSNTLGREVLVETFRFDCHTRQARKEIMLARWPVISIASVVADGVTLETTEYEVDGASGTLYRLNSDDVRTVWLENKVVVAYIAGWLLPSETGRTLPKPIEDACIQLVKAERFGRSRDPLLKAEDTAGIGSNTYWVGGTPGGNAIPTDVAAALTPYRNIRF